MFHLEPTPLSLNKIFKNKLIKFSPKCHRLKTNLNFNIFFLYRKDKILISFLGSSSDERSLSPVSRHPTPTTKHSPGDHWFYNSRVLGGHQHSNISSPQRSLSSSHQSPSFGISSTLVSLSI